MSVVELGLVSGSCSSLVSFAYPVLPHLRE